MHCLTGCFLVEFSPDDQTSYELVDGVKYHRIEIKLSQIYKRVFFIPTIEEKEMWIEKLNHAAQYRKLENDYELSEEVLGQGSYGKVIKGKNKKTGETVAIK
jgi:hypothetical protein